MIEAVRLCWWQFWYSIRPPKRIPTAIGSMTDNPAADRRTREYQLARHTNPWVGRLRTVEQWVSLPVAVLILFCSLPLLLWQVARRKPLPGPRVEKY